MATQSVQFVDPVRLVADIANLGLTIDDTARLADARPSVLHDFVEAGTPITVALQRQLTFVLHALETAVDAGADLNKINLNTWIAHYNTMRSPDELRYTLQQMSKAGELATEEIGTNEEHTLR